MTQPPRPKGCPLFLHGNGQWCRKVKGKAFYFGSDFDAALKRWSDEKDHLLAGHAPPRKDGRATLSELGNLYLSDSRDRVKRGKVRPDHPKECKTVLDILIGAVGGAAKPDTMTPQQWHAVRSALELSSIGKPVAQTTLQTRLVRVSTFLNWCLTEKYVKAFDTAKKLAPPESRLLKLEKASRGKRDWSASDLRETIDATSTLFRPVVLFGINCGLGAMDIALLARSQWKPGQEYLDCPRNKTGVARRVWLWDETREALAAAVAKRPEPAKQKYDNRLLLTKRGYPWCRVEAAGTIDLTRAQLNDAKADANVTKGTFYDLRRTFRTEASAVCDMEATNYCMGHEGSGQGGTYLQGIPDDRIHRVCDCVRTWLYGEVSQ